MGNLLPEGWDVLPEDELDRSMITNIEETWQIEDGTFYLSRSKEEAEQVGEQEDW